MSKLLQCIEQCHCSVTTLVLRWLGQCFWNYFDWNNIVLYVYLTILHGPEFQVRMQCRICLSTGEYCHSTRASLCCIGLRCCRRGEAYGSPAQVVEQQVQHPKHGFFSRPHRSTNFRILLWSVAQTVPASTQRISRGSSSSAVFGCCNETRRTEASRCLKDHSTFKSVFINRSCSLPDAATRIEK